MREGCRDGRWSDLARLLMGLDKAKGGVGVCNGMHMACQQRFLRKREQRPHEMAGKV